jgi:hypothetical protein
MYPSAAALNSTIERDLLEHAEIVIMSQNQASNISLAFAALRIGGWHECPGANQCTIITIPRTHSQAMLARPCIWKKIRFAA